MIPANMTFKQTSCGGRLVTARCDKIQRRFLIICLNHKCTDHRQNNSVFNDTSNLIVQTPHISVSSPAGIQSCTSGYAEVHGGTV